MEILLKDRVIFLNNAKCGSTSIRQALKPYSDISGSLRYPFHIHSGARHISKELEAMGHRFHDFYSFTTIRDPWSRLESYYRYGKKNHRSIWNKHYANNNTFYEFVRNFEKFCTKVVFKKNGTHFRYSGRTSSSIDQFAFDENGNQMVTDIIPIEKINTYLGTLNSHLSFEIQEIPNLNRSQDPVEVVQPKSLFAGNTEIIEIVAKIFATDIAIGNYRFQQ